MKTYSRRNSRPISRGGGEGAAGSSSSSGGGGRCSISTPATMTAAAARTTRPEEGAVLPQLKSRSSPSPSRSTAPAGAAGAAGAASVGRKRRRLSLAGVPVCSLGKTPPRPTFSLAAAHSAPGALGLERKLDSGGGGGGVWGVNGEGSDTSSVLSARRLWGAGDPLSVGRKR